MSIASNVLEVCREHLRGACNRDASECRFAHTRADTEQGKVTACLDYVKGRCSRDTCRYFHPPPHLCQRLLDGSLRDGGGPGGGSERGQGGFGGGAYSSSAPSSYGGGNGAGYGGQAAYGGDYSDDYSHKKSRPSYGGGDGGGTRSHLDELAVLTTRHQDEETSLQLGFQGQRAQLEQQQQLQLQTLRARQKNEQLDFLENVRGGGGGGMFKRPRSEGMYDGPSYPAMSMMQPPMQSLGYLDQPSHQGLPGRDYQRDGGRDGPRDGKRDSTLQVCRDFLRNKCARPLCSFAHPSPDVKVDADNRVNVCMDFRLRSCARDTCKFYHAATPAEKD